MRVGGVLTRLNRPLNGRRWAAACAAHEPPPAGASYFYPAFDGRRQWHCATKLCIGTGEFSTMYSNLATQAACSACDSHSRPRCPGESHHSGPYNGRLAPCLLLAGGRYVWSGQSRCTPRRAQSHHDPAPHRRSLARCSGSDWAPQSCCSCRSGACGSLGVGEVGAAGRSRPRTRRS